MSNGKHDGVAAELQEIFRSHFGENAQAITRETTAADVPGWDSMRMINIILAAQAHFGVTLRNRDIDKIRCVGDFIDLIERRLPA